ncbi:MAG: phage holin family protein [Acidobacteria bacterium]|nr:phage holin family protein [Acidobacteriota bacterium]
MRLLARLLLNGVALLVAAWLTPGLRLAGPGTALVAGAVLGVVNVLVKPVLILLTLPFTLVTLGLFLFVVNAICLGLTAAVVPGFDIAGFWSALVGALLVSIVSWMLNGLLLDPIGRPPGRRDR